MIVCAQGRTRTGLQLGIRTMPISCRRWRTLWTGALPCCRGLIIALSVQLERHLQVQVVDDELGSRRCAAPSLQ